MVFLSSELIDSSDGVFWSDKVEFMLLIVQCMVLFICFAQIDENTCQAILSQDSYIGKSNGPNILGTFSWTILIMDVKFLHSEVAPELRDPFSCITNVFTCIILY